MEWRIVAVILAVGAIGLVTGAIWLRRVAKRQEASLATLRVQLGELARLPGRLRRVAADPRTPRRARWLLLALAFYVACPIDPIPDFLPGIGFLDEIVIVPLALARISRMIPPEVWEEHVARRPPADQSGPAAAAQRDRAEARRKA